MNKDTINNNKTLLMLCLLAGFLMVGSITTIGNDINVAHIYNVTNGAGLVIGSVIDGVSCHETFCLYHPWYSPSSTYAKNGTSGYIDYSGTNAGTVLQNAINSNSGTQNWISVRQGTYTDVSVNLTEGTQIHGQGTNTIFTTSLSGAKNAVFKLNPVLTQSNHVIIKDIQITSPSQTADGIWVNGTSGTRANYLTLDNIYFVNMSTALNVSGGNENIYRNLVMVNGGTGIKQYYDIGAKSTDINIIGVTTGIYVTYSEGEMFTHTSIFTSSGNAVLIDNGYGVLFNQFTFSDASLDTVRINGGKMITFRDGYISQTPDSSVNRNNIDVYSNVADVLGLTFDSITLENGNYWNLAVVAPDSHTIKDVLITNNNFVGGGSQTTGPAGDLQIYGGNINGVVVKNNYLNMHSGAPYEYYEGLNPTNLIVSDNMFIQNTGITLGNGMHIWGSNVGFNNGTTLSQTPPVSARGSSVYFNTTDQKLYVYNNTAWVKTSALS